MQKAGGKTLYVEGCKSPLLRRSWQDKAGAGTGWSKSRISGMRHTTHERHTKFDKEPCMGLERHCRITPPGGRQHEGMELPLLLTVCRQGAHHESCRAQQSGFGLG